MEWRRRELSVSEPWSLLVCSELIAVDALIKADIGYGDLAGVVGLLFRFHGGRIGYDNWDDDDPSRISFDPRDEIWSEGTLVEWIRQKPDSL